jgi:DNA-binding response OmpR family regulator
MMVRWPDDRDAGLGLADEGVGVLYLVSDSDDPPRPVNCLEDWIRLPGDERDIRARLETLELRSAHHRRPPHVDREGFFHYRGAVLALAPDEAELAGLLAARFDQLVPDADLVEMSAGRAPALRVRVARLRSKMRQLDLSIQRIRSRGYRLQRI